jgi:hypothetical protein
MQPSAQIKVCPACKKDFVSVYSKSKGNYQQSCSWSCAQSLRALKHGGARKHGKTLPEYHVWESIKQRCTNPENPAYKDYGARGITICQEWFDSFEKFLEHVGNRPTPKHSIDRIENNLSYQPGNVKWSTKKEQQNNRRNSLKATINGETKHISEWAEIYKIKFTTVVHRIKVQGMEPLAALTTPDQNSKYATINGETKPIKEWLSIYKNSSTTYYRRINSGWDLIQAITTRPDDTHKRKD